MFYTNTRSLSSGRVFQKRRRLDGGAAKFQAVLLITEALLRSIGVAAGLTLAVGIVGGLAGGRGSRMLELQLSGDPDEVKDIVQGDPQRVKRLRRQLRLDYVFIAAYWLTFVGMSVAITRREGQVYDAVGLLAALSATATALLDVVENVRTGGVLALSRPTDQVRRQPVQHLRLTALAKWTSSALTLALLAALFLAGEGSLAWLGAGFLGVAVLGLLAVRWSKLIAVYFLGFFTLGSIVAATFICFTDDVLERL